MTRLTVCCCLCLYTGDAEVIVEEVDGISCWAEDLESMACPPEELNDVIVLNKKSGGDE